MSFAATPGPAGSHCCYCRASTAASDFLNTRSQKKSYVLTDAFLEANPFLRRLVENKPRDQSKLCTYDRICQPCYEKIKCCHLQTKKRNEIQQLRLMKMVSDYMVGTEEDASGEETDTDTEEESFDSSIRELPESPEPDTEDEEDMNECAKIPEHVPEKIRRELCNNAQEKKQARFLISNYSRVPSGPNLCMIIGCTETRNLRRVHVAIRAHVLSQKSIYIPTGARICRPHLTTKSVWKDIEDYSRPRLDTFTPIHVTNMLNLLRRPIPNFNFKEPETIENAIFKYYLGVDKKAFMRIYKYVPALRQLRQPKRALAATLCKLYTGDTNEWLSGLFRMEKDQYKCILENVKDCLLRSNINKLGVGLNVIGRKFVWV